VLQALVASGSSLYIGLAVFAVIVADRSTTCVVKVML
jgi:hypothetical protein